jgi:hypothetical protein
MNIRRSLNQAQQDELVKFLIDNWDIFARKPSDMSGISRETPSIPRESGPTPS